MQPKSGILAFPGPSTCDFPGKCVLEEQVKDPMATASSHSLLSDVGASARVGSLPGMVEVRATRIHWSVVAHEPSHNDSRTNHTPNPLESSRSLYVTM